MGEWPTYTKGDQKVLLPISISHSGSNGGMAQGREERVRTKKFCEEQRCILCVLLQSI